jgi:peptide/nickel transport system substrate-binding protein
MIRRCPPKKVLLATAAISAVFMSASVAMAETPKDTVVMAKQIDDIISMDPAESFEFSGSEVVGNMYDRLLTFDFQNVADIRGQLAESWNLGDDGRTYTFKMRPGVQFASGNPVTAADAAFSLQRAVILNKSPGFILTQFGFTKDNVKERIRAADPQTLVIVTEKAVAPSFFYYCLTASVGSIVDSKVVMEKAKGDDLGNEWLKTNSAGSGPFKLRSWRANEAYNLDAYEGYWNGAPKSKRVVVRHVPEPSTQRLLLEKGDIDYARNLTKDQLAAVDGNKDITIQSNRKGALLYLGLNQKNPNLAKPEVREALKYLVDYDGIQKNILSSTYVRHEAFLPKGFLGAIDDMPYKYDPAKSKELLAKAGLANGFSVSIDTRNASPYTDVAQAIQSTWGQAGVKVEIQTADLKQVLTKFRARNHDIVLVEWGPDYQDPHTNAETFAVNEDNSDNARSKTLAWRNSWDIPEMSKQTLAAVTERDTAKRAAMYEAIQREHQKISPFVVMFQQIEVAAHRKNADGFVIGPSFDNNLYKDIAKK